MDVSRSEEVDASNLSMTRLCQDSEKNMKTFQSRKRKYTDYRNLPAKTVDATYEGKAKTLHSFKIHINSLPYTALLHIIDYLTLNEKMCIASLVCHYWNRIVHDPRFWKVVSLQKYMKIDNNTLKQICTINRSMTHLYLMDNKCVNSDGMIEVLEMCQNLRLLDLTRMYDLDKDVFLKIASECTYLTSLRVQCCNNVTNEIIEIITKSCSRLEELNIAQCSKITDDGIIAMSRHSKRLKVLDMDQLENVTDKCLPFLSECKTLKELSVMACNFTNDGLEILSKLCYMSKIHITNNKNITDHGLTRLLKKLPHLEHASFSLNGQIGDETAAALAMYCPKLRKLNMISCNLTDKGVTALSQSLPHLEELELGWNVNLTEESVRVASSCLKNLKCLNLMRCDKISNMFMDEMVERYPHISYSSRYLDMKQLVLKAQAQGGMLDIDLNNMA